MFRHVVVLTLKPEATIEQRSALIGALRTLPDSVDAIRRYSAGTDAGLNKGNADVVVVGDFDDEAGYLVYRDHPTHTQVIADFIAPILASRAAIQYQM